jgi:glycosyltransferase involved in cell wall biosynthesis
MVSTIGLSVRFLSFEQIEALMKEGHEVVAVCSPDKWVPELRALGVQVETVKMERELHPGQDLRSLRALVHCFREHRFDVVHTHTPKAGLIGPVAARLAGVPVVVHTIYGLLFHDRMPWRRRALFWMPEKITATCAHWLLAQSREDMEVAVRTHLCAPGKIVYEGNGIDVRHFSPARVARDARREVGLAPEDVVVGSVGRLVYEKGFGELFAAAEQLRRQGSRVRFLVIGPEEPDQDDAIERSRLEALRRDGTVVFTGWKDDMPRWYATMDMFALPSHREGIPRSCMEAAAMGVPVIASDIRGCREVVRHGETGLLVPVRNAGALAAAIEQLAADPELRRNLGALGREHICRNFDYSLVIERVLNFYREVEADLRARKARP